MGFWFQVKRVSKRIYRRRKIIRSVFKTNTGNLPLIVLKITDPNTNLRTVFNLVFYLEEHYFIHITSFNPSFWLKFFNYLSEFKQVSVNPLMHFKKGKAIKILQTKPASGSGIIPVELVDQQQDIVRINVPYYKNPGFCWPENQVVAHINNKREGWIFIAGNANPSIYDHPAFERKYNIPNRYHVYEYLRGRADAIKDRKFDTKTDAGKQQIFVHSLAYNNLGAGYKGYLNDFNFMIAAPGVTMPLCHNLIEAMEYGCIPVFSYPDWLPVGLEHGINCFIYKTIDELDMVIDRIKLLDESAISIMRANLVAYYRRNFSDFKLDLSKVDSIVILNENKQMMTKNC